MSRFQCGVQHNSSHVGLHWAEMRREAAPGFLREKEDERIPRTGGQWPCPDHKALEETKPLHRPPEKQTHSSLPKEETAARG